MQQRDFYRQSASITAVIWKIVLLLSRKMVGLMDGGKMKLWGLYLSQMIKGILLQKFKAVIAH